MGVAVGSENKCHSVFGNSLRGVSGYPENLNSVMGSRFKIHIIIACAAHKDQPYPLDMEFLYNSCTDICIYKGTDSIIALGKRSGFLIEICFNKLKSNSRVFRSQLVKKLLIVVFCTIK